MSLLLVEHRDDIVIVTLNRPAAMNALSRDLRTELTAEIDRLARDDAVGAIILTGAGEKAFCAGLDLKELGADAGMLSGSETGGVDSDPVRALARCPHPVIAAINGVAITGGLELALACDIRIASTKARLADTHARVGILPDWGLSQKLSRLVGISRAKEMSLGGGFLDAATACAWGLVNRTFAPADLLPAALALANDIVEGDRATVRRYKRMIDDGYVLPYGEALMLETSRARQANSMVSAEAVEARRKTVAARARDHLSRPT